MKSTLTWAKKLTKQDALHKAFPHHYITEVDHPDGSTTISLFPKNVQHTDSKVQTLAEDEKTS